MAKYTIYGDTADGYIYSANVTYATARSGSSLGVTDSTTFKLGQEIVGGVYYLYETFLSFDTSSVSGNVGLTELSLCVSTGNYDVAKGFDILMAPYDFGTLGTDDWQDGTELTALTPVGPGFPSRSIDLTGGRKTIVGFEGEGIVTESGTSRFVLWSADQEASTAPTGSEYELLYASDNTGTTYDPCLIVHTYTTGYPYIASAAYYSTGGATAHSIPYPPDINAGDLLLGFVTTDAEETFSSLTSGWVQVKTATETTTTSGVFYKYAAGTETGTWSVTTTSEAACAVTLAVRGVNREYPLIVPAGATGSSATPDPPTTLALKESRKFLNLVYAGWDHSDTYSSSPTNYTEVAGFSSGTGSGDCGNALAYRELEQSTAENPGTFGISGTEGWQAFTVQVLGDLSPVVVENYAVATPTTSSLAFGQTATYSVSQVWSFTARESCSIEKITAYMTKVGSPTDDVTLSLRTAYDGSNVATTGAIDVQAAGWYEGTISSPYAVTAGTRYYIVCERTGTLHNTDRYDIYFELSSCPPESEWQYNGSYYTEQPGRGMAFQARKQTTTVVTGAASLAPDSSVTAAALKRIFAAAALAPDSGVTATGLMQVLASAALAGDGGLTATGTTFTLVTGSAALALTGGTSSVALLEIPGASSVVGAGAVIASSLLEIPASASIAGSGSVSISSLVEVLGSSSISGTGSMTSSGLLVVLGSSSVSADASVGAAALLDVLAQSSVGAAGGITASALCEVLGAVSVSGGSTIVVSGDVLSQLVTGAASLGLTGSVTAQGLRILLAQAALAGYGSMTVSGLVEALATAQVSLGSALTADALQIALAQAGVTAASGMTVSGLLNVLASASVSGASSVTAGAIVEVHGVANIGTTGAVVIVGTVLGTVEGSASISASASLTGTPILIVLDSAALSSTGALSASALVEVLGAGALSTSGSLTGSALLIIPATASLAADGALTASALLDVLGTAHVQANGALTAEALRMVLGAAQIQANGAAVVDALQMVLSSASLAGLGSMSASSIVEAYGASAIAAAGAVAADGLLIIPGVASLSLDSLLTALGDAFFPYISGSASITLASDLTVDAMLEVLAAATVTGTGEVDPTALLIIPGAAVLNALIDVQVAGIQIALGQAGLTGVASLSADAMLEILASADIDLLAEFIASGWAMLLNRGGGAAPNPRTGRYMKSWQGVPGQRPTRRNRYFDGLPRRRS